MHKHFLNLRYTLRHKWEVFRAGVKLGVPIYRLILHDWTKFFPTEWGAYTDFFYEKRRGSVTEETTRRFRYAWLHHIHKNDHHWQHWVMINGENKPLAMPETAIREMVADWVGAGRAQGTPNTLLWYHDQYTTIQLHQQTRIRVEELLFYARHHGIIPGGQYDKESISRWNK